MREKERERERERESSVYRSMYVLFTQPIHHDQDVAQGYFLR